MLPNETLPLPSVTPDAASVPEDPQPESSSKRKDQRVRLSDERSFGSITGSEFRVWGE